MTISCNVRKKGGGHRCPLPAIHGARQQAAHGRPAYPGGGRDLAIRQSLRSECEEKPIARRELPQRLARRPEPAILVRQRCGCRRTARSPGSTAATGGGGACGPGRHSPRP